jgi:hypothetical protein
MEKDTKKSMEERLLLPEKRSNEGRERIAQTWREFTQEVKRLAYIAGPMVVTTTALNLLLVISNMMVGHLGELALSSSAIAISLCNVTGISLLVSLFCISILISSFLLLMNKLIYFITKRNNLEGCDPAYIAEEYGPSEQILLEAIPSHYKLSQIHLLYDIASSPYDPLS